MTAERDFGRILSLLEQGKDERALLRSELGETKRDMGDLREIIAGMRTEFGIMNRRTEEASLLVARVALLEAGMSAIRGDLQALQSFVALAKTWSLKAVIGVLFGLALGGAAFSKIIDLILRLPR